MSFSCGGSIGRLQMPVRFRIDKNQDSFLEIQKYFINLNLISFIKSDFCILFHIFLYYFANKSTSLGSDI